MKRANKRVTYCFRVHVARPTDVVHRGVRQHENRQHTGLLAADHRGPQPFQAHPASGDLGDEIGNDHVPRQGNRRRYFTGLSGDAWSN